MSGAEELLKNCSELALVMTELEKEIPKLRKNFSECKNLHKELCAQIKEDEGILDKRFLECEQTLDRQMEKITNAIQTYEKTYEEIVGNRRMIQLVQEIADEENALKIQIARLNKRFDALENIMNRPDSLRSVLWKAGNRLPIKVRKEGRSKWSEDFYLLVERIDDDYAYGDTYVGDTIYKHEVYRSLDEEPFSLYVPKPVAPISITPLPNPLPEPALTIKAGSVLRPASQKISRTGSAAGFMEIPENIDDILPFN